jgi:choline-sulfatase
MPDAPNVLVIQSDEHSFRCLSRCDDERGEPVDTPALDGLAADGTNFDQAYCQMPLCTPSRICTLTGREVRDCNGWSNWNVLPPDRTTIPEAFGDDGYRTGLVGKMHLGGNRQFVGFDDRPYGDLIEGTSHQWEPLDRVGGRGMRDRTRDAGLTEIPESHLQEYNTMRESLSWIREREAAEDTPWFLWASFSRPHFPLTAPRRFLRRYWDIEADAPTERLTEPKVRREGDTTDHPLTEGAIEGFQTDAIGDTERQRARAAYFACVDFLDHILGEFLATLDREGVLDETIVVYCSDHGELAGEHGIWWKHTWHEASARVPLTVQTPGHRRGDHAAATIETPVSLADLFPTLGGLADVPVPDDLDGTDLSAAVERGAEPDRGPVVCDNLVPRWGEGTEFRVVRDGDYKYVGFRNAPELLFDIDADPLEQRNLAPHANGADREALERLRAYVDETMNFDAAQRERERDAALQEEFALDAETPSPSGNCYRMPDGTVVDADDILYDPTVVVDDPGATFDDAPESPDQRKG